MVKRSRKAEDTDITWPTTGPARRPIDQCPHRQVGAIFVRGLTPYRAEYEAPLERALINACLVAHDVLSIETQPPTVDYEDETGAHSYTADLALTLAVPASDLGQALRCAGVGYVPSAMRDTNAPVPGQSSHGENDHRNSAGSNHSLRTVRAFVECKPLPWLIKEVNLAKYTTIARALRAQGDRLDFIIDEQLPPLLRSNTSLLKRYLRGEAPTGLSPELAVQLRDGPRTIADLLATPGASYSLVDLYRLVAYRLLCIDWNQKLNRRAPISLPDHSSGFSRLLYDTMRNSGRHADLLATLALGDRPTDRQLLAAHQHQRRPLSPPTALGFVDGISPWQLGHLQRRRPQRTRWRTEAVAPDDSSSNRTQSRKRED